MVIKDKIKKIPFNELIYIFSDVLIKAIAFISLPFFLEIMTTSEFGEFSLYQSIVSIGMVVIGLNISSAIVRYCVEKGQEKKYLATALWIILGMSFILTVMIVIVYFSFTFITYPLKIIITMVVFATFNSIYIVGLEVIRSTGNALKYGISGVFYSVVSTLLGLALVYTMENDLAYWRLLSITLTTVFMGAIWALELIRKEGASFNRNVAKRLLSFSIPLIPFTISTAILIHINKIFLKGSGLEAVGIYSFAANLATLIYVVSLALNRSLQLDIFTAIRDKKDYVKKMNINFRIFYLFYILLIFGTNFLITIFGNEEYIGAVTAIPILALGYGFCYLFAVYSNFLYYYNRNTVLSSFSVLGAVFICIFNYILIPLFSFTGAALAMALAYLLMFLLAYIYSTFYMKVKSFGAVSILIKIILLIIPVVIKIFYLGGTL